MTDLRTAAQQALEALEIMYDEEPMEFTATISNAIDALRAALAQEQAEPAQEPDSPERRCGGPGCDGTCCQPVQEPAACSNTFCCRCPKHFVAEQAEPVQEPVGYWGGEFSRDGGAMLYEVPQQSAFGFKYRNEPLYTAPPQRKPLTEEEIECICASLGFAQLSPTEVARAIERAHGIGDNP